MRDRHFTPRRLAAPVFALCLYTLPGQPADAPPAPAPARARPNVVFILTDNQGAWTLGCYGNPDIRTPRLDRLAGEGTRFTNAFSNNAVCSPARATLLTGLTPSQHGVHRYLGRGGAQVGPRAYNTIEEFTSLPEVFKAAGYVTGLSGKWHLGDNFNPQDGFTFWTTKPTGHSPGFLDQEIIEDGRVRTVPRHLTEHWTDRGIAFIDAHQDGPAPFFLLLAYNGPYALSRAMREPVPPPYADPYRENPMASFPRPGKPHPWQHNQHDLIGDTGALRNLAGQVTAVDAGVGRILDALESRGLGADTLVVFTSDQGAVAGHAGFWGMGDHSRPLHLRDGTLLVPLIFRWPGVVPAGAVSDHLVAHYDLMASLLSLLGHEMPQEQSPGRDYAPLLRGRALDGWEDVVFAEFENVRAVRTPRWKYVERKGDLPARALYRLADDPDELDNLAGSPANAAAEAGLRARLHAWFQKHADPKWDLWAGGTSKSGLLSWKQLGLPAPPREGRAR